MIARSRLAEAVQIDPQNAQAWSDLAEASLAEARCEPERSAALAREAVDAATQALNRSVVVPEFWTRRARAFDLESRWRDGWADFVEALALAPRRADIWSSYAYHLSLCDREMAKWAVGTCLELDPWNSPALALRKRLEDSAH
jgi:Tfp pilus assembly protein PilF